MADYPKSRPLLAARQAFIRPLRRLGSPSTGSVCTRLVQKIRTSSATTFHPPATQIPRNPAAASAHTHAVQKHTNHTRRSSELVPAFYQTRPKMEATETVMLESTTLHRAETPPRPPVGIHSIQTPDIRLRDWRARVKELKEENTLLQRGMDRYGKGGKFATRQHDRNVGKIEIYHGKIDVLEEEIRETDEARDIGLRAR